RLKGVLGQVRFAVVPRRIAAQSSGIAAQPIACRDEVAWGSLVARRDGRQRQVAGQAVIRSRHRSWKRRRAVGARSGAPTVPRTDNAWAPRAGATAASSGAPEHGGLELRGSVWRRLSWRLARPAWRRANEAAAVVRRLDRERIVVFARGV